MSIVQIIVLAIVQGLAELLPGSSSAHVIVAEKSIRNLLPRCRGRSGCFASPGLLTEFIEALRAIPAVEECHSVAGKLSMILIMFGLKTQGAAMGSRNRIFDSRKRNRSDRLAPFPQADPFSCRSS